MRSISLLMMCGLLTPMEIFGDERTSIISPGATVKLLAHEFQFTEGPTADAEGNVYFTDQPNDRIMKWGIDGVLSSFLQPSGRSNGLFFDLDGSLLACADENNQLWSIAPDGSHTVLVSDYKGKLLNGPNDLWVRPDRGIYFTDPFYQRPYWKRGAEEQDGRGVYFLSADRKMLRRVAEGFVQPNGIVGTPDGKRLYVSDIGDSKTYSFAILDDGSLESRQLFCDLGSDGMTIDSQGNVYLTGKGVTVFAADGRQIERIDVPESWTANVRFGGTERKTLFMTASRGLYSLDMNVSGVGPMPVRKIDAGK